MVKILYFSFDTQIEPTLWNSFLRILPPELQQKTLKYFRWQDQYTNLFGKLLLKLGLMEYGYNSKCLESLKYNGYNKPFLDAKIFFNLSHSSNMVICAFSQEVEIGIDIEEIKSIEISEFDSVFTPDELKFIQSSIDPINTFFKFWTTKESVVKALGQGLSIPLREVVVSGEDKCIFRDRTFIINKPEISPIYFCSLASTSPDDFSLRRITLSDLEKLRLV